MNDLSIYVDYLVVGGGVAGVCCVEELCSLLADEENDHSRKIGLICGRSGYVKVVSNAEKLGQITESFDVGEASASTVFAASERIRIFQDNVKKWNAEKQEVRLSDDSSIVYGKLCIATGARPKRMLRTSAGAEAHILTLRDMDSVSRLRARISGGAWRRIIIVGNGGIATELVFELEGVEEIVWAIRHGSISATYFDEVAARFFAPKLEAGRRAETTAKPETRLDRFTVYQRPLPQHDSNTVITTLGPDRQRQEAASASIGANAETGCALGPHWLAKLGQTSMPQTERRRVRVIHDTKVRCVQTREEYLADRESRFRDDDLQNNWPVWVEFETASDDHAHGNGIGESLGADFIIEATGVVPNSELWTRDCLELKVSEADGGICVDEMLRSTVPNVYAAGDVCTMDETTLSSESREGGDGKPHWMQIRLWTQARQMGLFCARSMAVQNVLPDICFDLFTHVTTFFGYKVILLGDFLAAKLSKPYQIHYRVRPSSSASLKRKQAKEESNDGVGGAEDDAGEYIKVITGDGHVHGAVLIGDTDLEETMENLILNQTDIIAIEDDLLDPDIDLEDYFD